MGICPICMYVCTSIKAVMAPKYCRLPKNFVSISAIMVFLYDSSCTWKFTFFAQVNLVLAGTVTMEGTESLPAVNRVVSKNRRQQSKGLHGCISTFTASITVVLRVFELSLASSQRLNWRFLRTQSLYPVWAYWTRRSWFYVNEWANPLVINACLNNDAGFFLVHVCS